MPASEGPEFWGVHVRDQVRCIAYPPNWIGEVLELRDILWAGSRSPVPTFAGPTPKWRAGFRCRCCESSDSNLPGLPGPGGHAIFDRLPTDRVRRLTKEFISRSTSGV
jgi:hypothetical protein